MHDLSFQILRKLKNDKPAGVKTLSFDTTDVSAGLRCGSETEELKYKLLPKNCAIQPLPSHRLQRRDTGFTDLNYIELGKKLPPADRINNY